MKLFRKALSLVLALGLVLAPFPILPWQNSEAQALRVIKTFTATDLQLSTVAGTAFFQFAADKAIPAEAAGKYIQIVDVAGKKLSGYLKEVGTGETLEEKFLAPITIQAGWADNGDGTYTGDTVTGSVYKETGIQTGGLYKPAFTINSVTAGQVRPIANSAPGTYRTAAGTFAQYLTSNGAGNMLFNAQTFTGVISGLSFPKVLTPSTYGYTISSTPNGSTMSWTSMETGFALNSTSAYTVTIYDSQTAQVNNPIINQGTLTQANCRISAVAGTAFVDSGDAAFTAALTAAVKYHDVLEIYDSAKGKISGAVGAIGTGETLNTEVLDSWTNTNYDTFTVSGVDITNASETGGQTSYCTDQMLSSAGVLYKFVLGTYTKVSGVDAQIRLGSTGDLSATVGNYDRSISPASVGAYYFTHGALNYFGFRTTSNSSWSMTGASLKQVLTPSTGGATIFTLPGGATQSFGFKDTSFNYNDASGYTWRIVSSTPNGKHVTSGNISAGTLLADLTDSNAFVAPVGINLTPYQDGKHLIAVYDASQNIAYGYISSTAPGGEALSAEIATGTLTIKKLYKITATEANHFGTGYAVDRYFTSLGTETCDASNKVKENTMPAATGALIVSSQGGATRSWTAKSASFNPNGACTIKIWRLY